MTSGSQRLEVRGTTGGVRHVRAWLLMGGLVFMSLAVLAQASDDAPPLRPIRAELPPTFWEQHAITVILYSVEIIALVAFVAWLFLKSTPPVLVPIEVQTRRELEALRKQSEDRATLSGVSRCLRRYFAVAFGLPPGELTTTEFSHAVAANEKIGPSLAEQVAVFLRQCDVAKFSPVQPVAASGRIAEALEIVAQGEARREQVRQAEAVKPTA